MRLPDRLHEDYIDAAWRRCLDDYRLDPEVLPVQEHIGGAALKRRLEALALFELVGRFEMRRLLDQISQQVMRPGAARARFALMLVDAEATILAVYTDPETAELGRATHMSPGYIWDERHRGTNGPGTCVHDGQPRMVHRDEHFFACKRNMSCSAAPIRAGNGELLGAIDVSIIECDDTRDSQLVANVLVGMSARSIEQLHFCENYRDALVMHVHERPEFAGLPYDSLLAIDRNGRVLAVDSSMPRRLGHADRAAIVGRTVSDLFDVSVDALFTRADTAPLVPWPVAYGAQGHGFATLQPARRPAAAIVPTQRGRRAKTAPSTHPNLPLLAVAGEDPVMLRNVWQAEHVMNRDIHLLLLGETGTGKDTFARAIHQASDRNDRPFIVMSCAAIPESLIESELFGYEPGAFTGARASGMRGKAVAAHGGTLFLDEIGDMPLSTQARLLRLLEEKEVVPLGSTVPVAVDIRVISATHEDLEALVARGDFRMDLFYRLNGLSLTMPALRDRHDRAALIDAVAQSENDGKPVNIAPDARKILGDYPWPGNIRELRNTLRTAIAFAGTDPLAASHLPGALGRGIRAIPDAIAVDDSGEPPNPTEHARILTELERQHWRVTSTASALGMSRNTLYRKLHRYGLLPIVNPADPCAPRK